MERGKLASLLPARRVFHFLESDEPEVFTLAGKEYRIQTKIFKGQDMISVCSVCSAEVNLNRHFFDDFGEIPEEISCLNPQEKGQLPLAVLLQHVPPKAQDELLASARDSLGQNS